MIMTIGICMVIVGGAAWYQGYKLAETSQYTEGHFEYVAGPMVAFIGALMVVASLA